MNGKIKNTEQLSLEEDTLATLYPSIRVQVRNILKEIMRREKISQRAMAKVIGISEPQMSKFMKSGREGGYDMKGASIEKLFNSLGYHPVIIYTKLKTQ